MSMDTNSGRSADNALIQPPPSRITLLQQSKLPFPSVSFFSTGKSSHQHILLTSSDADRKQPLFSSLSIVPNRTDSSIGRDWRTQEEQPEKESLPTTSVFRAGQSLMTKGFGAMETPSPIATLSKQSAPPAPPPLQTRSCRQSQAREDEA